MRVAALQLNSGPDLAANLAQMDDMLVEAVAAGARLVVTPEMVSGIFADRHAARAAAMPEKDHPVLNLCANRAQFYGIYLVAGSVAIKRDDGFLQNRCYVFDPGGTIIAHYDKIHLFDADPGDGRIYRESDEYAAGQEIKTVKADQAMLGLSICFDLRFPLHYRRMAQQGAQIMLVPAAFTVPTGQAHWEILLRARAIETGSFVIAAAQTGYHADKRESWGHSMIIDPWGQVLAALGSETGFITADLDLDMVVAVRRKLPVLEQE